MIVLVSCVLMSKFLWVAVIHNQKMDEGKGPTEEKTVKHQRQGSLGDAKASFKLKFVSKKYLFLGRPKPFG